PRTPHAWSCAYASQSHRGSDRRVPQDERAGRELLPIGEDSRPLRLAPCSQSYLDGDELPTTRANQIRRGSLSRDIFFVCLHGFSGVQPQVLAEISNQPRTVSGGATRRARADKERVAPGAPCRTHSRWASAAR